LKNQIFFSRNSNLSLPLIGFSIFINTARGLKIIKLSWGNYIAHEPEAHQVELFVAGLHKSIHTDVNLMYPVTLEDAMDHARAYEERDTPEDTDTTLVSKGNFCGGARPSTPELAAPPKATVVLPNRRPLMRLSPVEMDERRAKGLCYNCDDKFTPGHRCKRLYACWVDASEEEAPDLLETSTDS
jgi:hypothetical protein